MKVMLINPRRDEFCGNLNARAAAPPLGLLYIASNLIKNGYEVSLIDQIAEGISDEELLSRVKKFSPDLVGFSTMTNQGKYAALIAEKIKKINEKIKILFGGIHATFNPVRILKKYPFVDFVIRGEGEFSIIELLKAIKNKMKLKDVSGLVYKIKNTIKFGKERKLIKNLDSLPFPARELVKNNKYGEISGLKIDNFSTILSSRGCPYECTFCCCSAFVGRCWRTRDVGKVVDELELMVSQGYKNILFFDDSFTLSDKRVLKICREIRKRKLKFNWMFEGRVNNANYEVFKEMVKAGCKVAYFGAESGNQRILNIYKKNITPHLTKLAVKKARKAGIDFIVASFILGAPTETLDEIENTIKFANSLDVDFIQVTSLIAYPGTQIWNELVRNKYIDPEKYWEEGVEVCKVYPNSVSLQTIRQKVKEAYARFINRKSMLFKHILRLLKSKFRLSIFLTNLNYFLKDKRDMVSKLIN